MMTNVIVRTEEIDVDAQGIVDAIRVVAHFNPPMQELVEAWEAFGPDAARIRDSVANAVSNGSGIFEGVTKTSPRLADCIHNFVYDVTHPHNSITTKHRARDEVAKVVLKLV